MFDPREVIERHGRPPLRQKGRGPQLAFQKHDVLIVVPANAVLAATVRVAAMEDVAIPSVEVEAGRPILIAEGSAAVRIALEARARPVANPRGRRGIEQELDLGHQHGDVTSTALGSGLWALIPSFQAPT